MSISACERIEFAKPIAIAGALYRVGYDNVISIEHENRAFEETEDLIKRGFLIARGVLRPYIK